MPTSPVPKIVILALSYPNKELVRNNIGFAPNVAMFILVIAELVDNNAMLDCAPKVEPKTSIEKFPLGAGEMPDGYLTLQDRAILATITNATKELYEIILKQQKELNELKEQIKLLIKR